jgi:mannitol/fructose-specific phosphotransferase system IIA component (Ntr-type)
MSFWKQFKSKACSVNLKASDKDPVLEELVDNLVRSELLEEDQREAALRALREREDLASTGVGMGVAIPHVKLPGLDQATCSLSVHKEGVEWSAIDGAPVNLFFCVLRPERAGELHDPEQHVEMMAWIARVAREPDFRRFALAARTKKELLDLLKEMAAV